MNGEEKAPKLQSVLARDVSPFRREKKERKSLVFVKCQVIRAA